MGNEATRNSGALLFRKPRIAAVRIRKATFHVKRYGDLAKRFPLKTLLATMLTLITADARGDDVPAELESFIESHCLDCHDGGEAEAGLDFGELSFDLSNRTVFDRWVLIHDRIRDGEMPPPVGYPKPVLKIGESVDWQEPQPSTALESFQRQAQETLHVLGTRLAKFDVQRIQTEGRARLRRMNRLEYENTLRQILHAPWLQIAHQLPEDGVKHLFNKVADQLDVSHVHMSSFLKVSQQALRTAVHAAAYPSQRQRFYAREQRTMQGYLHYRFGQKAATRSIVPLLGLTPQPDIIRKRQPVTVGDADPATREREAMGVFSGVYSATTKYDFSPIHTPIDGLYRLRFKTYTFMAGPNGADGGDDHGLTGGNRKWWRPDRNVAFIGRRTEPITLYALSPGGDSRWLTTFDSRPEPSIFECTVALRKGEGIRPDAARLVRTRPGWSGNPNAIQEGVPGFAMQWLEVEGPLSEQWPPASYQALFGDLPFEIHQGNVVALPKNNVNDAQRLLASFYSRAMPWRVPRETSNDEVEQEDAEEAELAPYIQIYKRAVELGSNFTDAMITAASAILCSPEFLYFEGKPGALPGTAVRKRLSFFLWNGPPGLHESTSPLDLSNDVAVAQIADRMLADPRSDRFINAFLDYWLDLRDINANTPDSELYPDYYLDELLTESSVLETRLFFRELVDHDLPVTNLVDSNFAFVNERLAEHYGLPIFESVRLRRVQLPNESARGGLLTQASVLRVTANGTTTSPVIRGAWIAERILGMEIPAPPSGVAAVEPDIRGAKTIREQLEKHRSIESCNACHARFDPLGFALESFDVTGGWRERYRSVGIKGDPVQGIGKNGHLFRFKLAQTVDCSGHLLDDREFNDINELKRILVANPRQLARNLVRRLIVYATGAPIGFGDRTEVERILDESAESDFGVRTLIREVVQSRLFLQK